VVGRVCPIDVMRWEKQPEHYLAIIYVAGTLVACLFAPKLTSAPFI
jgi:hypothetical protein